MSTAEPESGSWGTAKDEACWRGPAADSPPRSGIVGRQKGLQLPVAGHQPQSVTYIGVDLGHWRRLGGEEPGLARLHCETNCGVGDRDVERQVGDGLVG